MTFLPSRARRYAVESPAIPAPTTQTSARSSRRSAGDSSLASTPDIHTETLRPLSVFIVSVYTDADCAGTSNRRGGSGAALVQPWRDQTGQQKGYIRPDRDGQVQLRRGGKKPRQ